MSTQCRFCGDAVRPDSMFCPSCGQLVGSAASAPAPPFPGGGAARPASGAVRAETAAEPLAPVPLPEPLAEPRPGSGERTDASAPAPAPALPAPTAIRLPDGAVTPVDRLLVLGRSPERGAAEQGGLAVRLDDPERAMSRVHLLIAPDAAGIVATDPGSANGTLLERDGARYALVAGTPTALVRGDRILLGDAILVAE